MINLIWSEIRQVSVEEDTLYSALLYIYRTYIGDENDNIDAEDITELVTEDEFLEKFKKWYLSD